jgi:hypothetical protein
MTIDDWRSKIDEIDRQLVELLNERSRCVVEIGRIKHSTGEPLYCFFHSDYAFSMPPGEAAIPGRIILFEQKDFGGKLIDIESANPDLSTIQEGNFNKQASSFVILGGNWSFYQGPQFTNPFLHGATPLVLGPGSYPDIQSLGIQGLEISSLKVVSAPPNF